MKIIAVFWFYIFFSGKIINAQFLEPPSFETDFDLGFLAEMGVLYFEKKSETNYLSPSSIRNSETENGTRIYPLSLYLSGRLIISEFVSLEVRPGIFFGWEEYLGTEIGIFLRNNIWKDKIFVAAGINFHFNYGTAHNSLSSTNEDFIFYGLNIGLNMSKSLAFILSYYYKPNKDFLFREYNYEDSASNWYLLKDVIKLGFDYTF